MGETGDSNCMIRVKPAAVLVSESSAVAPPNSPQATQFATAIIPAGIETSVATLSDRFMRTNLDAPHRTVPEQQQQICPEPEQEAEDHDQRQQHEVKGQLPPQRR